METKEKVFEIIKDNTNGVEDISLDMHLTNNLEIDSLDMLMIVNTLEDEYSIVVDSDCLKDLKTVADVVEKVDQMLLSKV